MQGRIQPSLLNLEHLVGPEFNGLGDSMTMPRAQLKSAKNQKIQRSLQEFDAIVLFFSRHSR